MIYTWKNLNVGQYRRLLQNGDSDKPEDLVWALTGKSKNDLTIKEIDSFRVGDVKPKEHPFPNFFIGTDGQVYALQDIDTMPFGLFDDIVSLAKDPAKNLVLLTSYLYRPVEGMSLMSLIKLRLVGRMPAFKKYKWAEKLGYRWLNRLNYTTESYNPLKCEERLDVIEEAPAYIGHHVVTFFLVFSRELQKSSLISFQNQLKKMRKTISNLTLENQKQD